MTTFTVRLFGPLARSFGADTMAVQVDTPTPTCGDLVRLLPPELARHRLAVNHEYAAASTPVRPDDEIALIGMVNGG